MFETAPLAGNADGSPERDEPIGVGLLLRPRPAMQPARERVVGVERREDARLVTALAQLARRAPRCGA